MLLTTHHIKIIGGGAYPKVVFPILAIELSRILFVNHHMVTLIQYIKYKKKFKEILKIFIVQNIAIYRNYLYILNLRI